MESRLETLKRERLRMVNAQEPQSSILARSWRKYRELSRNHSQGKVIGYFVGRIAVRARRMLSRARHHVFKDSAKVHPHFATDEKGLLFSVCITGGLGDALIVARLMRDVQRDLGGEQNRFDVYAKNSGILRDFFSKIPGFRQVVDVDAFESFAPYYSFALVANQFVFFRRENMRDELLVRNFPEVLRMYARAETARRSIECFIAKHPFLDGAFSDIAAKEHHKRHLYLHEMLGISYGGDRLDLPVDLGLAHRLGLRVGAYMTIHDGWDANFALVTDRPTKAMPLGSWVAMVAEIKSLLPWLQIVQIGGGTGENIRGVDVDLKGKLDFLGSLSVLAGSQLHLDTESGLVHAAACLGVRSVVMFGPTNVDWFGYARNINIAPTRCGNCWWSTNSWMDQCAAGYERPVCTSRDSIAPGKVAAEVVRALSEDADGAQWQPDSSQNGTMA